MILIRAGQALGLLFLIGPVSDLVSSSDAPARKAVIAVVLAAFVALYLAVWPVARPLRQRGPNATRAALGLLAALGALTLLLGAPGSFALLFWYVVAAAGLALPAREAMVVTAATAAVVAAGLAATGSDGSTVAAYTVSLVAVGAIMASLGSTTRANRKLREARQELAQLAVSEERSRIARDLHDLLGHTLSLIALKTELAAKLLESDPRRAQTELGEVQEVTRQALSEVREAVHGYRQPALADELEGARSTSPQPASPVASKRRPMSFPTRSRVRSPGRFARRRRMWSATAAPAPARSASPHAAAMSRCRSTMTELPP
jgi:two-component system, NarL family, sensor histidine kinase DesK